MRRHTRAAKLEMDEAHDEDCQNRPPSKAAGTPTSPERGKVSSKKARQNSTATERALQSQVQKQGKEICQLREIVSELSQAGTPPSTPSKVPQQPLPGQAVYTQPTYHVSPSMYGGPLPHECQQPCYLTPPKATSPIQTGSGFLSQCPALMATPSAQQCVPTAHGYPPAALEMNTDFASPQRLQAPPTSLASSTAATPMSGRDSPVVCFRCNQTGHIQRFCPSRHGQANGYTGAHRPGRPLHNRAATQDLGKEKVYVKMRINGIMTSCLVDTGSDATLIPASFAKGCRILPTRQKISAANGTEIPLTGYTSVVAKLGKQRLVITGVVTEHVSQPYLGITTPTGTSARRS